MEEDKKRKVLKKPVVWKNLYFYRKSDAIFQLTAEFCHRFLPAYGDRTVDQMTQSARSGKQNIIEGSENGLTSSEMEINLINVARGSLHELRADYQDYLNTHHLSTWTTDNERLQRLRDFCHSHNDYEDYAPFVDKMSDEEFANLALTLLHQTDKLMCAYLEKLEERFVTEGGIKERMYSARTGYRQKQDEEFRSMKDEIQQLKNEKSSLEKELKELKDKGSNAQEDPEEPRNA